jgi:long-chain fatty acid transport protein
LFTLNPEDMLITRVVSRSALVGAMVAASGWFGAAGAQGFGLSEIGTCAVARGFAVTGATCNDGSVIYWNPAAATRLPEKTITGGIAAIKVTGSFRQDTTGRRFKGNVPTEFPPHLFGNYTRGQWAYGLGIYVPYGLTSQWRDDFPGRFSALKASLQTIYIQPNIAYAITPNWSVGIGPVFGHSSVELIQAVDLAEQLVPGSPAPITFGQLGIPARTEFARAKLEGSGTAWGVNVGVHGKITPEWTVGVRYLSELKFKYKDANATFEQRPTGITLAANNPLGQPAGTPLDTLLARTAFSDSGALVAQKGNSKISHPWQFQIGVGYTGLPGTTLSFDIARIGWSSFDRLPIEFEGPASGSNRELIEDFDDSWAFRFGAEHILQAPGRWQGWTLRGGFSYAGSPAPDETVTPLLPDMNRQNFSLGVGIPISTKYRLDASYLFVGTQGRRGRIHERASPTQTAQQLNTGAYALKANVFSLSFTASF